MKTGGASALEKCTPLGTTSGCLRNARRRKKRIDLFVFDEQEQRLGAGLSREGGGSGRALRRVGERRYQPYRVTVEHRSLRRQHHHHRSAVVKAAELPLCARDLPVRIA